MKCSEYLWKRLELDSNLPENVSPEQLQGLLRLIIGNDDIVSDVTGEVMSEREANSIYGRQYVVLNAYFDVNDKESFINTCVSQMTEDESN